MNDKESIGIGLSDWKEVKLGDVADILNGYAFNSSDFINDGIPVIKIKNIIPPIIDISDVQGVSLDIYNEKKRYELKYNDILISMTGSNVNQLASAVGKIGRVRMKNTKTLLNQRVGKFVVTDCKRCDYDYLYYYLVQEDVRYNLASSAGGSANQANISPGQIKSIKIKLPPLKEQKAIAKILASLDEKIEVNNQINKTLEAMAQELFKHWFVDFEFPNEDGEPYKSSGGEMVESELGMIPKGWEVKSLDELVESVSVKHRFPSDKIIFLNTSDIYSGEVLNNNYSDVSSLPGQAKKSIQKNDILYSEIRPQNRRFAYVDFDASDFVVSTKLMVLRAKSIQPSIPYILLTSEPIINELQVMAESRSGTFPQITFDNLKYIKIALPSFRDILLNSSVFNSILNKVLHLKKENKKLSEIRDSILPKLMSGEIRVPLDQQNEAEEGINQ